MCSASLGLEVKECPVPQSSEVLHEVVRNKSWREMKLNKMREGGGNTGCHQYRNLCEVLREEMVRDEVSQGNETKKVIL